MARQTPSRRAGQRTIVSAPCRRSGQQPIYGGAADHHASQKHALRRLVDAAFLQQHQRFRPEIDVDGSLTIFEMVKAGLGHTLKPSSSFHPLLVDGELAAVSIDPPIGRTMSLFDRTDLLEVRVTAAFFDFTQLMYSIPSKAVISLAWTMAALRSQSLASRRQRAAEFRRLLDTVEGNVPGDLDIHVVMDNASSHKAKLIRDWFAKRANWHCHFTPTSSSWINQVERFFALLTDQQIKRGAHRSTKELEAAITSYIEARNKDPKPLRWTKTADDILAAIQRFCRRTTDLQARCGWELRNQDTSMNRRE